MDFDINIEELNLEELREFTRNLMRLAKSDAQLIETMRDLLDLMENKQGE